MSLILPVDFEWPQDSTCIGVKSTNLPGYIVDDNLFAVVVVLNLKGTLTDLVTTSIIRGDSTFLGEDHVSSGVFLTCGNASIRVLQLTSQFLSRTSPPVTRGPVLTRRVTNVTPNGATGMYAAVPSPFLGTIVATSNLHFGCQIARNINSHIVRGSYHRTVELTGLDIESLTGIRATSRLQNE